jgi:hypothetical protein
MTKLCIAALLLPLVFGIVGCKKSDPKPESEPSPVTEPTVTEPKPEPAAEAPRDTSLPQTTVTDGIPTEEDYEEEASKVITADNLEAELDKLEAEIADN